jgi:hypothetical protein
MYLRLLRFGIPLVLAAAALTALSLGRGQERPPAPPASPAPAPPLKQAPAPTSKAARDLTKLTIPQRQLYLSGQRGAEWLRRINRVDGRFLPGVVPALCKPLEGDHYLRQAGATLALARVARFFQDERAAAVARQAVLTLLLDTEKDPQNAQVRRTLFPPAAVSRLGAAGLLVLAIHELPAPGDDLLAQSEELCRYIRQRQRADGSLSDFDPGTPAREAPELQEAGNYYAGLALQGLMSSQRHRPAAWKLEVVRKARSYYQAAWRANKQVGMVPPHSAACAEAYLLTREQPLADFVLEMNDWLCTLQYEQMDPRQVLWQGGFMGWVDGRPAPLPPGIGSASCAESLVEACRVARQVGDIQRHPRYRQALERGLQFLTTLQYTEANAQHFAEWYRPEVLGGFHASHQDGTLRIDYTQHAVCALVAYLEQVAALP